MSFRTISRTASLALAVTGALLAVGVSALVQACGGESETKDGATGQDASSEGAAGAAGEGGSEEAGVDAPSVSDAPGEVYVVDVVPQDDVTLDVIPAE